MFYFQGMVSDSGMLSLPECSSPAEFSQCEGCHSDALDRRASVTQFLLLSLWSCPCCWYVVEHVVHVIVHWENEIICYLDGKLICIGILLIVLLFCLSTSGAVLEHIEEFMRKWQTSTKGHS